MTSVRSPIDWPDLLKEVNKPAPRPRETSSMRRVHWSTCAFALLAAGLNYPAQAQPLSLNPGQFPMVRQVDERFQSYNVEVAEVIGGRFWRPYAQMEAPRSATSQADTGGAVQLDPNLFSQREPVDLTQRRLRVLAAALGPSYLRFSGSWANTVYFQNDDDPPLAAPPQGYRGVLTRAQWRGVVEFARAVDAKLVISFAVNEAVRDEEGAWTPVQARPFMEYTRSIGGDIYAAELFNEPNLSQHAGGPPDYDGADFARDIAVFRAFARDAAPNMRIVGPGDSPGLIAAEEFLSSEPRPRFDVFDYHFYPAVSQRCAPADGPMGISAERAMTSDYLSLADRAFALHEPLRNQYAPGAPIWITETAGAACGGAPWSATFLDSFRYLDQMGRLAKQGVDAIFHNTLAASEYGLIDESTLEPRPNYWAALLWRRLMGSVVLDAGPAPEGVHVYAHCLRDALGGVSLLAINFGHTPASINVSGEVQIYALSASELQSTSVRLNGRRLTMGWHDRLPELRGRRAHGGDITLAPVSITFVAAPDAANSACN